MEAQEYEQQQPMPMPMQSPQFSEDMLRYQLETDDILEQIELIILGKVKVFDKKAQKFKLEDDPYTKPLITIEGWSRLKAYLRISMDKIFSLTDLDDDIIRGMVISAGKNMIDMIELTYEEYGIKSSSDASLLVRIITNAMYANLRKSHLATYLKFLRTTIFQHQTQNISPPQRMEKRGGSILDKILRRG